MIDNVCVIHVKSPWTRRINIVSRDSWPIFLSLPKEVIYDDQIVVWEEGDKYNSESSACIPCNRILYHDTYRLSTQ